MLGFNNNLSSTSPSSQHRMTHSTDPGKSPALKDYIGALKRFRQVTWPIAFDARDKTFPDTRTP